ncbi:4Fe-4S dicluster domain-containing protein [Floridanema evergladense]|uniref:4Fe-4S dicluster domain-containing protein n=1 Tax=Floridaenema evergladense BLCC-F167 TaxID=3153639 RepID=A0ABV4WGD4_9CYAN
MTYTITNNCIACDRCLPQCPTNAISVKGQTYQIDSKLCNGCVGFYSVPQCQAVCPTNNGCVRSLSAIASSEDYWESWFNTYNHLINRINKTKQNPYWQKWFNTYSQELKRVIVSR